MTYFSDSDVELWYTTSGLYQIPFFCRPVHLDGGIAAWHISQAVTSSVLLSRKMKVELDACAVFVAVDGHIVDDNVFRAMFTKAPGITPSFYFRKSGEFVHGVEELHADPEFQPFRKSPNSNKSFIESLHRLTNIDDIAVLKALWNAICNHMAYWLIVEQRPIDFGWFKLHAFPVRDNWKQILVAKHKGLKSAARLMGESRMDALEASGVVLSLQQTDIIGLRTENSERTVTWTLEVEPADYWDDYVNAAERERLRSSIVRDEYVSLWGRTMLLLRESIVSCLCRFALRSTIPAATVVGGHSQSGGGFVEYLRPGKVRPVDVDDVAVSVSGGDCKESVRKPSGEIAGLSKNVAVPKVRRVRLAPSNMRNTR